MSFKKAVSSLFIHEGGYQDHPDDPGNYNLQGDLVGTNYGISGRFYDRITNYTVTKSIMKNLSKAKAKEVYKKEFWNLRNLGRVSKQFLQTQLLDIWVNHSVKTASDIIEAAIREFRPDFNAGRYWGNDHINVINDVSRTQAVDLNNAIAKERIKWMEANASETFVAGLVSRASFFFTDHKTEVGGIALALAAVTILFYNS